MKRKVEAKWPKAADWWEDVFFGLAIAGLLIALVARISERGKTSALYAKTDALTAEVARSAQEVRYIEAQVEIQISSTLPDSLTLNGELQSPDKGAMAVAFYFGDQKPKKETFEIDKDTLRLNRIYGTLKANGPNWIINYRAQIPGDSPFIGKDHNFLEKAKWVAVTVTRDLGPPFGIEGITPQVQVAITSVKITPVINGLKGYQIIRHFAPPREIAWYDEFAFQLNSALLNI